ncbi:MAG: Hsp20/alpha crystallin family protein [Chloroflexi bacterium]|nr:Hsp20/alpha crystallin family protein [Chloroflexota bacterium]
MLSRFSLFNDPMFQALDRLTQRMLASLGEGEASWTTIPVNVSEDGERFYIQALTPGLAPEQLNLTVQGGTVVISGELNVPAYEGSNPVWTEVQPTRFRRAITLGADIQEDKVEAHLNNGVLTIIAPKAERARARAIPIQAAAAQKQLASG